MAKKYQNIDNLFDLDRLSERWLKPHDFYGIVLILKASQTKLGTRGEYYVITCEVEDTGEVVYISTGASQPMMAIQAWLATGSPPVRFTFAKEGDRDVMAKPDAG